MGIFSTWKKKDKLKKGFFPEDEVIKKNIYKDGLTGKQYRKRWNFFHRVFKYKFFVPLLKLVRKFLDKYIEPVPMLPHNKNIILFDKAFEDSIIDWNEAFLSNIQGIKTGKKLTKKEILKSNNNVSALLLRNLKEIVIAGAINDTAYREFLNILMFNIAKIMNKNYDNDPEHLFYINKSVNDVIYYYVVFMKEQGFKLKNVKLENCKDLKGKAFVKFMVKKK